ncbi:hypothetical protein ES705_19950 [subsurface metagenome]
MQYYPHIPWSAYYPSLDIKVLLGTEDVHWFHLPMDVREWTFPKYFHQN